MKLTFGKYRGFDLADEDVPVPYLVWLEEQEWITEELRKRLNFEIERRRGDRPGQGRVAKEGNK